MDSLRFKLPKNNEKYHWTNHVIRKMMQYGLSPSRVLRIIRFPKRVEKGIVPDTVAVMQPRKVTSSLRGRPTGWKDEVWVMYATRGKKKIIITAWRYPGVSPVREEIPIPADILEELKRDGTLTSLK